MEARAVADVATRQQPTTHGEWAAALATWFFRPAYAQSHVMFLVDDAALGAIYGGDPEDALRSLVTAIRPKLRRRTPARLFSDIERTTRRWKLDGGDGAPPCLPLLALTVLAATRMARSSDRAGHNYYKPFIEVLGLEVSEHDLIGAYGETIPDLWHMLLWWLDERHHGELGWSTISSGEHLTRIGYADSQTLFHSSDSDKLTRFLSWLGLAPGETIATDELLAYFRLWAARHEDDLTPGAKVMLREDESPRQLTEILGRSAAAWQGVLRDDRGRTEAAILLTLRTFPRPSLGMIAERPDGFPACLSVQCRDEQLELVADADESDSASAWYHVDLRPTARALEDGITLTSAGRALRLAGAGIHVLHKHPDLGCWASSGRLRPGEPAWLLIRRGLSGHVEAFLGKHARRSGTGAEWSWVERDDIAPAGWRLMRDVVVDAAPANVGGELDPLRPRLQTRLSLRGGLPLARGRDVYLTGGEPDLWLPEGEDLSESRACGRRCCAPSGRRHRAPQRTGARPGCPRGAPRADLPRILNAAHQRRAHSQRRPTARARPPAQRRREHGRDPGRVGHQ